MDSQKIDPRSTAPRRTREARPRASQLWTYRNKRNFSLTSEPSGAGTHRSRTGLVYAIQKHRASHLHYDLRLEEDGVLKSWAIPKEPPRRPGEKRLAVETEDHPLDYAFFKGTIPEGEYGAGTVTVWDRGTYEAVETKPGLRRISLRGKKLKGTFALVKLRAKPGDKGRNWLFIKTKDDRPQIPKRKGA